jgi:mevalonate kinase
MNNESFKVYAKWILAGEHSVLRGVPALVFPLKSKALSVTLQKAPELSVRFAGSHGNDLELIFWGILEKALQKVDKSPSDLKKIIELNHDIPIGAGLGASATLCVAVGKILQNENWIAAEALYDFCRDLENVFHGESSGVDIAVSLSGGGIKFQRSQGVLPVEFVWKPHLYVSYSGKRGVTLECIRKVKNLIQKDPAAGDFLDGQMNLSVDLCKKALLENPERGYELLKQGMDLAGDCFEKWGLASGAVADHLSWLKKQGASSVKPTGSGDGGFVLSLWKEPPPRELLSVLNPCF